MENKEIEYLSEIVSKVFEKSISYNFEIDQIANASDWIDVINKFFSSPNNDFIAKIALDKAIDMISLELGRMENYNVPFSYDEYDIIKSNISDLLRDEIAEIYFYVFKVNLESINLSGDSLKETGYFINEEDRFENISESHIIEVLSVYFESVLNTQLEILKLKLYYSKKPNEFYKMLKFDKQKDDIDELIDKVMG